MTGFYLVFLQDPLLFASIKSGRIAAQAVIAARVHRISWEEGLVFFIGLQAPINRFMS